MNDKDITESKTIKEVNLLSTDDLFGYTEMYTCR